MARKIHKLNISINENYCLLGLTTDAPDYKLCWLINNQLEMDFERIDDLELYHKKNNNLQVFSIFQYNNEENLLTFRIIKNRSETGGYYLDELKNIDYLIHIQGEILKDEIERFIEQVIHIPSVRFCIPIDLGKVKDRMRLQLW